MGYCNKEEILMTLYSENLIFIDDEREGNSDIRGLHICTYVHAYIYKYCRTLELRTLREMMMFRSLKYP